ILSSFICRQECYVCPTCNLQVHDPSSELAFFNRTILCCPRKHRVYLCCVIPSGGLWIGIVLGIAFNLFSLIMLKRSVGLFDPKPIVAAVFVPGVSYFLLRGIYYWRLGQPARRLGRDFLLCTSAMIVSGIPMVTLM